MAHSRGCTGCSSSAGCLQIIDGVLYLESILEITGNLVTIVTIRTNAMEEMDEEARHRFTDPNIGIVIGSGICLFLHFGLWVWSLDHTIIDSFFCL